MQIRSKHFSNESRGWRPFYVPGWGLMPISSIERGTPGFGLEHIRKMPYRRVGPNHVGSRFIRDRAHGGRGQAPPLRITRRWGLWWGHSNPSPPTNISWEYGHPVGHRLTGAYGNAIIGNTSSARRNRTRGSRITSVSIRRVGRPINYIPPRP